MQKAEANGNSTECSCSCSASIDESMTHERLTFEKVVNVHCCRLISWNWIESEFYESLTCVHFPFHLCFCIIQSRAEATESKWFYQQIWRIQKYISHPHNARMPLLYSSFYSLRSQLTMFAKRAPEWTRWTDRSGRAQPNDNNKYKVEDAENIHLFRAKQKMSIECVRCLCLHVHMFWLAFIVVSTHFIRRTRWDELQRTAPSVN